MHNPTSKDYTFFSTRHCTHPHIDYFLCSSVLKAMFHTIAIEPAILSDHNALITTNLEGGNSIIPFSKTQLLIQNISINTGSVSDPAYIWQATKGFIRDFTSSFAANLKKKREARIEELEERCKLLEQLLKTCFSKSTHSFSHKSSRAK